MDIIYLIILTILLIIVSLGIMFKNDSLTSMFVAFVLLVIAGTVITTN